MGTPNHLGCSRSQKPRIFRPGKPGRFATQEDALTSDYGAVPTRFIAECLGVSDRRVQQLAGEGVIPHAKKGRVMRFDVREAVRAYVEYLKEIDAEGDGAAEAVDVAKAKAERDLKQYKAREAELQVAELERTMHRADDVEAVMEDLVASARSMLVALPGRVAKDAAEASGPAAVAQIVRAAVDGVLAELVNYRYDPEAFAAMVRDRRGWRAEDADEGAADH